ncbi:DNA polymerase III subunit delta' [Candidatus Desantisbacteria bacterium CG2_30_40_21]|uniref:DNA polymerase III subunit delta n=5 Tax=unclassified Candidatus Desantisiibacteriota TaxID=3106372 RepID=A0A2M7JE49_9BACT|nr:MAG: DNA polymerase III subunit delta' [Candidatus Desantisbacteria bacterium CG2_30_40_21]PIP41179.1 MAG: DNA polymerase III subunit delta' [Candidatus Desantisbacteria bacterium CG23_combo_of_CG06-09_8_20_14_all_40_23]PIX17681.1 MAG: DNA polymerase III subunit delta' [Candidatus Desantisbacteria bacterium CG_4_8_14_3_um_filter_40_12]PIY18909.1 MAG: DNA polymerase III subunit delta' [Candidatus Desantisbacteria bacterium CG_4_10_14_3_um_filter_40_18]PJB29316.1 MAG: DNA polymerase III subuni
MLWNTIIGQTHAVEILKQSIQAGRIPSAYLFFGPDGVGKGTTANVVAKTLNCPYQGCDICRVCVRINENNYPDIRTIVADGKFIKIGQIREINKDVSLSIFEAQYRVYILKNVEKMNIEAANAFLKILEEPPGKTLFILTTNAIDSLLSTIVSRCQLIRFNLLLPQDGEKILLKKGINQREASLLTGISAGRPGKAIEYKEKGVEKQIAMVQEYLNEIFGGKNELKVFEFAEEAKAYSDDIEVILDIIILMIPNFFSSKAKIQAITEVIKTKDKLARNINLSLGLEVMFFNLLSIRAGGRSEGYKVRK